MMSGMTCDVRERVHRQVMRSDVQGAMVPATRVAKRVLSCVCFIRSPAIYLRTPMGDTRGRNVPRETHSSVTTVQSPPPHMPKARCCTHHSPTIKVLPILTSGDVEMGGKKVQQAPAMVCSIERCVPEPCEERGRATGGYPARGAKLLTVPMPRDDHYYYCQWHVCMCGMSVTLLPPDPLCAALSTGFTSAAIICCATHAAHASQIGTFGTPTSMPYNPLLSKAYAGVHSPARVRDCSAFFTPTQSRISQNEYHTVLRTGYPILQHYSAYRSSRPAASFEAEFRCLFGGIRRCRSVYPVNSSPGTRSLPLSPLRGHIPYRVRHTRARFLSPNEREAIGYDA